MNSPDTEEQISAANQTSIKHIADEALHDLLHFDVKLFRSLPLLLFKPGVLVKKQLSDERGRYIRPFTLFVFVNFVFFIVKSRGLFQYSLDSYRSSFGGLIAERMNNLHITAEIFSERFNTAMRFEQKEYLVIMVPLFTLVLHLLFLPKRKSFAENLFFSLDFYAFFIIFLMLAPVIIIPIQWLIHAVGAEVNLFTSQNALVVLILLFLSGYLFAAIRNFYRDKLWLCAVKSMLLSVTAITLIVWVYRPLLFFVVMHSVSE